MNVAQYVADPIVGRRIDEYCGATAVDRPSSVYVSAMRAAGGSPGTWDWTPRYPVDACRQLLREGADVARSLWDRSNLLIHLDIDYQNIDVPAEPYNHPLEVFHKLEPLYRATGHVLRRFGLPLLDVMTGRGYHFTGRVPLESGSVDRLARLVTCTPRWFDTVQERRPSWMRDEISPRHARAYAGLGMVTEFLAHRVLRRARRRTSIPIVLNGTVVGTGVAGRECASLDVSYAGDPLDVRHVRVAFGPYQKHRGRCDAGDGAPFVARPRGRASLAYLLGGGRELRHAARAARRSPAWLPVVEAGVSRLIDAYESSALAAFHRRFYAGPACSSAAFDALAGSPLWAALPGCVREPLLTPNDRLLQPAVVQHVTRVLLAHGLQAREIAGIVYSRYLADFDWGPRWFWLDAETRAEFDVRVFAGLVAAGLDQGVDFNCRSAQEKDLCPGGECPHDLRATRERLLERMPV